MDNSYSIYVTWKEEKEKNYKELKVKVKKYIQKITFEFSIMTIFSYLKTKATYNHFKNEKNIIKCLAELNTIIYKTEYEIRELIRKNVPDSWYAK